MTETTTALLEIDGRSGALIRLVLWIVREGRPNGTVTYTLIEGATRGDGEYRLESHLDPDAEIEIHRFKGAEANDSDEGGTDGP